MKCWNCGYAPVLDTDPDPETVTVGPVTLTVPLRARKAAKVGLCWSIAIMLVIAMVVLDLVLCDVGLWPVGFLALALQVGIAAGGFWYHEKDLFS